MHCCKMLDDEWADPYADADLAPTSTVELKSDSKGTLSKVEKDCRSPIAKILEDPIFNQFEIQDKELDRLVFSLQDLYISNRVVGNKKVVPFDFSTPSPDDLIRAQKKTQIFKSKQGTKEDSSKANTNIDSEKKMQDTNKKTTQKSSVKNAHPKKK